MSDLTFLMRLNCRYTDPANNVEQLLVEHLVNNEWLPLELNIHSPGFDVFIYSILTCQHLYFRSNAAERDLVLDAAEGIVTVHTDNHRVIKSLYVDFVAQMRRGTATDETIDYIKERMGLCPVSSNLSPIIDSKTSVSFSNVL